MRSKVTRPLVNAMVTAAGARRGGMVHRGVIAWACAGSGHRTRAIGGPNVGKMLAVVPLRQSSTAALEDRRKKAPFLSTLSGLAERVAAGLGMKPKIMRAKNSEALLQSCIGQANIGIFYSAGKVSKSFRSSHALLVLHAWMIHKRLLQEGEMGKQLEEALFDRLWEESTFRIRALKVNELMINKYLKEVQEYSFGACVSYDHALTKETPEERLDEMAGALYRHIYLYDEHMQEAHVIELAKYVLRELDSLKKLPADAVFESRFRWGRVPTWRHVGTYTYKTTDGAPLHDEEHQVKQASSSGAESPSAPSTEGEGVTSGGKEGVADEERGGGDEEGEWRTAYAQDGRLYYWNVRTRESRWEKPN